MRKAEIDEWHKSIAKTFGKPRPPVSPTELKSLHSVKDFTGMFNFIRKDLRLETKFRIAYLKSGECEKSAGWIKIPKITPIYGTREFKQHKFEVFLRKHLLDNARFEFVVVLMAHELCHVILSSTGHPLRHQEEAVDLTAMYLGYRSFFQHSIVKIPIIKSSSAPKHNPILKLLEYLNIIELDPKKIIELGYLSQDERKYATSLMESC